MTNQMNQNKCLRILGNGIDSDKGVHNSNRFYQPHTRFYGDKYKAERDEERSQDIKVRTRIEKSIFSGLKFQEILRLILAGFYIAYLSVTSGIIFWVIIEPYPKSVKEILAGVCLANILSILAIMYKFSFEPITDMIDEFKRIGGSHWNDLNQKYR